MVTRRLLTRAVMTGAVLMLAGPALAGDPTWFDGRRIRAAVPGRTVADAAGGVVVFAQRDPERLKAWLEAQGIAHRALPLTGAYEIPTAPGLPSWQMTHRFADSALPVRIEPNWSMALQSR